MTDKSKAPAATEGARRPMCRDCADFGPICPNSGKPCASPAPAVGASPAANEVVARLFVRMERHDMGQSLAPPPPPFRFAEACPLPVAQGLPVGEYDLCLSAPAPASVQPSLSDSQRLDWVMRVYGVPGGRTAIDAAMGAAQKKD